MDDPVNEIRDIVRRLTSGTPNEQQAAIDTYFTTNAAFIHPFCRTGSFEGSRLLIHAIFRWYKIMSPVVEEKINSIAYDEANMVLYVSISQIFSIWFVPFHRSPVNLTTRLQLTHKSTPTKADNPRKFYISEQNDLYQVDQFVRFFAPWGLGVSVVYVWHAWATFFCVLLAIVFAPFTRLEQRRADGTATGLENTIMDIVESVQKRRLRAVDQVHATGRELADRLQDVADDVKDRVDHDRVKQLMGFGAEKGQPQQKEQFGNLTVVST